MKIISGTFLLLVLAVSRLLAQNISDSVVVLPLKIPVPSDAKKLGSIREGNNATQTHCDYQSIITDAQKDAKAMGGNLVKITELIQPAFIGKCYSFKADVYLAWDISAYRHGPETTAQTSPAEAGYATLYIYRLQDTIMATQYKLHINDDSVLCTVKSRSADIFKVSNEGIITLWAQTEKRQDLKFDVKRGHNYYIRCGVKNGEIRMVPVLQLMDEQTGQVEFSQFAKRKKETNAGYLQQIH